MLTKYNNQSLFKCPNIETNKKERCQNIIDHNDCILQLEKLYEKIKTQEKKIIYYKNNYDNSIKDLNNLENNFIESCNNENILYEENKLLKKEITRIMDESNKYDYNTEFGDDIENLYTQDNLDIIYIKKQIKYYNFQFNYINNFLNSNNIKSFNDLIDIINFYKNKSQIDNNSKVVEKGDRNIFDINKFTKEWNDKYNCIKSKISKLKPGTIIVINGKKKMFKKKEYYNNCINEKHDHIINKIKIKNELLINNIKRVEEDFNIYYKNRISIARKIIGNNMDDDKIIELLSIYDKLNKDYKKSPESLNDELINISKEFDNVKLTEYNVLIKFGEYIDKNNINDKSQIKDFIEVNKKFIKNYESKDKYNRFISTSKRIYKLSSHIETNILVNSRTYTKIRDISNDSFDNLLKLIENQSKDKYN